jgi:hypothetical protein
MMDAKAKAYLRRAIERSFQLPEGKTWNDVKWGTLFLAFGDGTFDSLDYDPRDTARPDAAEDKSLGATRRRAANQTRG